MASLSEMRAAYEAAEAAGDEAEADRLWDAFCAARRAYNQKADNAAPGGQTWGQIIGLPDHD